MTRKLDRVLAFLLAAFTLAACLLLRAKLVDFRIGMSCIAFGGVAFCLLRRKVSRQYREYLFDPVTESQLPETLRALARRITPTLEGLGFHLLGDFRLLHDPVPESIRVFLNDDARTIASIVEYDGVAMYVFTSVLDDGGYIECCPLKLGKMPDNEQVPLLLYGVPGASVEDLYHFHRNQVWRHEAEREAGAVELDDDWKGALRYGHWLAGWDLHERGDKSQAPPKLRMASASSV